jgi:hypothetical protein
VKKFLKKRLTVAGVLVINIPHQRMRRKTKTLEVLLKLQKMI